jgi:hypothetical protein
VAGDELAQRLAALERRLARVEDLLHRSNPQSKD